ncbi:MAG: hypothetical protein F4X31_07235 [Gammaproteobacteria bacterium]|nr:hypothetical protein [Gammaproteobacteria bacterium]
MADSSPVDPLGGRTVVLAGEPSAGEREGAPLAGEGGALRDQAEACLAALGARIVSVAMDGAVGPAVADLKAEVRVQAALERVAAFVGSADALVFVGRDLREGEGIADFIEESIASYHFHLKLAKRLRVQAATDVVALAWSSATGEEAALAADIRNGALRQMSLVAASEGGPLKPPLLANAVTVSGEATENPSGSLTALLGRLLARPQGYVTGTSLAVAL